MNKSLLRGVCGMLIAFFPTASFAFTYNYYKPIANTGNNFLLSWGPFGSLENYDCDLTSYACARTDIKNFPQNGDLPETNDKAWYNPAKNLAIYKTTDKTQSEKTTRYFVSSNFQNKWTPGKQLLVSDDIQSVYWPEKNRDEAIFITAADPKGKKDIIRFDLDRNLELARKSVSDNITNTTLSPDGYWLAYFSPLDKGTKNTVLLDFADKTVKEYRFSYSTTKNWELLTDENRLLAFSPDSRRFAFLEDSRGFSAARLANLADIESSPLNSAETIGSGAINTALDIWFPNNSTLLLAGNEKKNPLNWNLYSYDIPSRNFNSVVTDIGYLYEMRPLAGKILLGRLSGPNLVPVLYDPDTKKINELILKKSAADKILSKNVISFKNGLNGVIIKNIGLETSKKTPLVIWLHGGPFRQIGKDYHSYPSYAVYDWVLDQLALQGAVIIKVDYAGSYGYGNETAYNLVNNVGKNDIADIYVALREAREKFNLKGKTYLIGNSYGGYLGPRALVAHPEEFSGAIAINGVFEWRTLLNYLRTSLFNVHFDKLYDPNDPKFYEQASITAGINKLTPEQKIVIVNGMADTTINPDQSYTFYELLKTAGKNGKIVSIPEENHIFMKPSSIETICKISAETIGLEPGAENCRFK